MLFPLSLDVKQSIVASVVLTMYFPCVATFVVLFKEMGYRDLLRISSLMISLAILVGTLLNLLLGVIF